MESLKLFFSYGHEAKNSIIVDMIKARLENEHHHEVWFDRERIPASENWRRKIHDGIESSDRVVSFMSEHAMRTENDTPGVCIDELSIALSIPEMTIITILLEAPEKVKAPSTLTAVQWLDMSDWAEKYKIGGEAFESYFDAKFALILSAVENEKNFYFHGEVEGLRKSLLPDTGRLSLMAYNQLGSCYNMLYRQSTGEDRKKYLDLQFAAKENSLKDRIETYGEYSRYTALGYDYMARAILDKSREKGEPLPPEAAKNSDKAMNISSYVLGSESALFARTLVTKALLLEYSGDYRAALGYAERAVNIYREYGESESVAAERTEIIRSRIAEHAAAAAT